MAQPSPSICLIGADGVHSTTRALVFGPEDQFSRYLGYTIACYPLADRYGIGHDLARCISSRDAWQPPIARRRRGEILIFFMYQVPQQEHLPREQRLPRLRRGVCRDGLADPAVPLRCQPAVPVFMDAVIQIQMPTWHQGRVALVGDACDCPTLLSGQGASLAMGGAYLLAHALHETADYQEAFRRYEQQMYAYVQAQQKSARSFAKSFLPGSPLGLFVQQTMMKVLLRATFRGLLRRQMGAESILPPQDARSEHLGGSPERLPHR